MTLDLDLGSCDAKIARAREHLHSLQRETRAHVAAQEATHAVRFSPVDPETGWCEITLIPQDIKEPRLSAILGDVIHNLRCALDYAITTLVEAHNVTLTTSHQFPIFTDAAFYASRVGTKTTANPDGPLKGITEGLTVVEDWQPYHTKPDPRTDALWGVHRFSNADKHRQPAIEGLVPVGRLDLAFNGYKVEEDIIEEIAEWSPDQEIPVGRIRFDPPRAENLRAVGKVNLDVRFVTPEWRDDPRLTMPLRALPFVVERVSQIVDSFRYL
jgi:hypothetical protein